MSNPKFKEKKFYYKNLEVIIKIPEKPNQNMDWVFKCDYNDEFMSLDYALLEKGFHIVYMKNLSRWAYIKDIISKGELAFYLNTEYNLSFKFSLLGYGSGGSIALKFASLYPEFIYSIILDSPVVDFISCPGKIHDNYSYKSWTKEFSLLYPEETLITLETSKVNPKNSLNILSEYEIPVFILYSLKDEVVPFSENGKLIIDAYENKDIVLYAKKEKEGHASFGDDSRIELIVDFIESMIGENY